MQWISIVITAGLWFCYKNWQMSLKCIWKCEQPQTAKTFLDLRSSTPWQAEGWPPKGSRLSLQTLGVCYFIWPKRHCKWNKDLGLGNSQRRLRQRGREGPYRRRVREGARPSEAGTGVTRPQAENAGGLQRPEEAGNRLSSGVSGRKQPCEHLDFQAA